MKQKRMFLSSKKQRLSMLLLLLILIASGSKIIECLHPDFNFWMVVLLSPFCVYLKSKGSYSVRYALLSLLMLLMYPLLKVQTLYVLAFIFSLLFLIENIFGKLDKSPLLLAFLMSPFITYFLDIFGFPMRLMLSNWSVKLLNLMQIACELDGSIIVLPSGSFSVDQECAGLNMALTVYLLTILFVSFSEKKYKQYLSLPHYALVLLISTSLILVSNLVRIIILVIFKSPPHTFSHEFFGVVSLIFYALLPMWYITKWMIRRWGKLTYQSDYQPLLNTKNNKATYLISFLLIALLGLFNFIYPINQSDFSYEMNIEKSYLSDYEMKIGEDDIYQFYNDSILIYIKPPVKFFASDHNPSICWKGGGYELKNQKIVRIGDKEVCYAELHQSDDILHTLWWFDNGNSKYYQQIDWRMDVLMGAAPFKLINVSSHSRAKCFEEARRLLQVNIFEK